MGTRLTGKVMHRDFTFSKSCKRQAVEFLRSRGFDEPARTKCLTDAVAICFRDGGKFDLSQCSVLNTFTMNTWVHGFNKLIDLGVVEKVPDTQFVRVRTEISATPSYYSSGVSRYSRISDLVPPPGTPAWKPINRDAVVKYQLTVENEGFLSFVAVCKKDSPPSLLIIPVDKAYIEMTKLVQGGN